MMIVSALARRTTDFANQLLPTICLLCGTRLENELLCAGCELDLPHLERAGKLCQQCSLPLESEANYCGHCLHKPPAFSHSVIPFSYQAPLDFLIHQFKYQRKLSAGRVLAQLLGAQIQHHYQDQPLRWPELILPVPLHWSRRWQRGFNQADLLGQELARQLQLPQYTRWCQRRERTPAQQGLNRAERQKNLRKAFVMPPKAITQIRGKCVALVDDVVTTTATMRELSQLLVKQGAGEVHVWALARTLERSR